jgi:hypothetical protein
MRDGMRALLACCGGLACEKQQIPRLVLTAQARLGAALGMTRFLNEILRKSCFQQVLGRYFLRAALLAEFLEEFFLAERIGAVQQTEQ